MLLKSSCRFLRLNSGKCGNFYYSSLLVSITFLLSSIDPVLYSFPFRWKFMGLLYFSLFRLLPKSKSHRLKSRWFWVHFKCQMLILDCVLLLKRHAQSYCLPEFCALFLNVSLFSKPILCGCIYGVSNEFNFWLWMLSSLSNTCFHIQKCCLSRFFHRINEIHLECRPNEIIKSKKKTTHIRSQRRRTWPNNQQRQPFPVARLWFARYIKENTQANFQLINSLPIFLDNFGELFCIFAKHSFRFKSRSLLNCRRLPERIAHNTQHTAKLNTIWFRRNKLCPLNDIKELSSW